MKPKRSHILKVMKWVALVVLLLAANLTVAQSLTIWSENFNDLSDGTMVDNGSTAWSMDVSDCNLSHSNDYFEVKSNRIEGRDMDGVGILTTEWINISSYTNVAVSAEIFSNTSLNSSDSLNVFVQVNSTGSKSYVTYNGKNGGNITGTLIASDSAITGDSIRITIEANNDHNNERYYFDNLLVSGDTLISTPPTSIWCEDFTGLANGTTVDSGTTAWEAFYFGSGNFDVQSGLITGNNLQDQAIFISEWIDISDYNHVEITADLSGSGSLEAYEDSLFIYYELNYGDKTLLTDGMQAGSFSAITASADSLSGAAMRVVIHMNNNAGDEYFYVDNICLTGTTDTTGPDGPISTWCEKFNLSFGTNVDTGATAWSISYSGGGTVQVENRLLTSNNLQGWATLTTEWIDITGLIDMVVYADIFSSGSLTINQDSLKIYYEVDNGSQVALTNGIQAGHFGGTTANANSINGDSIRVIVMMYNSASDHYYYVNNICLNGTLDTSTTNPSLSPSIWCEDFEDRSNGDTVDSGSTSWSINYSGGGSFEVLDGEFYANNIGAAGSPASTAIWQSEWIDISNHYNVNGSVDLNSNGTHLFENLDSIIVYYSLDNGPLVTFTDGVHNGVISGTQASFTNLNGDSIQIYIYTINSTVNETYYFDNICLTGLTSAPDTLFSIANDEWDQPTSWSYERGGVACSCIPNDTTIAVITNGYTIDLDSDGNIRELIIENGGILEWQADYTNLDFHENGKLYILNGGTLNENSRTDATIRFVDFSNYLVSVEDNTNGLDIDVFYINAADTIWFNGSGKVFVDDALRIDGDSVVMINNISGSFYIDYNLYFEEDYIHFINNDSLEVGNSIYTFSSSDDNNTFTNSAAGSLIIGNDIELEYSAGFRFYNYGYAYIGDDIKESDPTDVAHWYNYSGSYLSIGQDDNYDWEIYTSYNNNTVEYHRSSGGNQYIYTPSDNAYYNLITSGTNVKLGQSALTVNGDLTVRDNSEFRTNGNLDLNANLYIQNDAFLNPDNNNDSITVAGNWTNTSNNGNSFDEGLEKVTFDGTGNQIISATGGETFFDLEINKASGQLILGSPVTLNDNATMTFTNGIVVASAGNELIIEDDADVTNVSDASHVMGPVVKRGDDAFTFPVGNGTLYRLAAITAPSNSNSEYQVEYFDVDPSPPYDDQSLQAGIDHVSSCEYWMIEKNSGSNNITVTLSWGANSCGVTNLSELIVCFWDSSNKWKHAGNGGTTGTTSEGTIQAGSSAGSWGPFTLGSSTSGNPLPIHLLDFTATPDNNEVVLNWNTAWEMNNDYFTIERSLDGQHFEQVVNIDGAGSSNEHSSYQTIDHHPLNGISYYRLKQTDYDGKITYSQMVSVDFSNMLTNEFEIFPNPANSGNVINIQSSNIPKNTVFLLYNLAGDIVYREVINSPRSQHTLLLPENLHSGVYFATLIIEAEKTVKKLIIR